MPLDSLAKDIPAPANDVQYLVFAVVLGIVLVVAVLTLGPKFLELKFGRKPEKETDKERKEVSAQCAVHSEQIKQLDRQLETQNREVWEEVNKMRSNIAQVGIDLEKSNARLFRELLAEMDSRLDRRDAAMREHLDTKLEAVERGLATQFSTTFRPLVEEAVSVALKARRRGDE